MCTSLELEEGPLGFRGARGPSLRLAKPVGKASRIPIAALQASWNYVVAGGVPPSGGDVGVPAVAAT